MTPRRLYLDNAATSFPKPATVIEAMTRFASELGASAGRGAYREAVETGDLLSICRRRLNQLFNGESPKHFVFTHNCTHALNQGINGLLDGRDEKSHVVCSAIDHNSILRPLTALKDRGRIEVTRVPVDSVGRIDPDDVRRAMRRDTKLITVTHASNVTGVVQPVREIGAVGRELGVPMVVDAAQSAGHLPIDLQLDNIDLLAVPGHKGLIGPAGTGFLYIRPGLERIITPLIVGGTGSISEEARQPESMPDRYESGTHNAIGVAGLSEGVKWVLDQTVESIASHELDLVRTFIEGVSDIEGLRYFGPQGVKHRIGVFSVRINGIDPHELSMALESSFGVLTRAGLHCAPFAHECIGTLHTGGTTRFSFGPFLTRQDVKFATDALAAVVGGMVQGQQ